eukprot:TRINITY_DN141_c0_g1_i4.p1 TRINITY_DN141_c0_g1~~TRINITY_DN141_c0_g1_i4.p1  ORF type:complete len:262 (+),score=80.71 TRINITY_DN141_c0_g1_i4:44-787(+)
MATPYNASSSTTTTTTTSTVVGQQGINTTIFVTPIAAPSILGLYAFAGAAAIVGSRGAHWYGISQSPLIFWPFILTLGIVQVLTALWAFRARDNLATVFHGVWGAFFIAYACLNLFFAQGTLAFLATDGNRFSEFGMYWITVAAITWVCVAASFAESLIWVLFTACMAVGATMTACAYFTTSVGILKAGGYLIFISAAIAFYQATAWLLEYQYGRPILPSLRLGRHRLTETALLNRGFGEPGVKKGQ